MDIFWNYSTQSFYTTIFSLAGQTRQAKLSVQQVNLPLLSTHVGSPRSSYKVLPDWRLLLRFNKRTNNRNNGP